MGPGGQRQLETYDAHANNYKKKFGTIAQLAEEPGKTNEIGKKKELRLV